ncbi:MAG: hypothetical protein AAFN63_03725 [Pseudomonadota bacterium]
MAVDSLAVVTPDLQRIDMGSTAGDRAQEEQLSQVMSDTASHALTKALAPPGASETPLGNAEGYLGGDLSESYLPAPDASNPSGLNMEDVSEKLSELYLDVTVYKVAWEVAKRSGRDIEALLKGQ